MIRTEKEPRSDGEFLKSITAGLLYFCGVKFKNGMQSNRTELSFLKPEFQQQVWLNFQHRGDIEEQFER